ncbi:MAG: hypothetical protein OXG65_00665 [Chloroflexi bacterium]|nr:hypothetical protein [Chloroflexota bacterium]
MPVRRYSENLTQRAAADRRYAILRHRMSGKLESLQRSRDHELDEISRGFFWEQVDFDELIAELWETESARSACRDLSAEAEELETSLSAQGLGAIIQKHVE